MAQKLHEACCKLVVWFFHPEKAVNGERLDFSKMSSVVSRTGRGRRKSERFILLVMFSEYFFSFPIHWKWFYLDLKRKQ